MNQKPPKDNENEVLIALVAALKARDGHAMQHSKRVAEFVWRLSGLFKMDDAYRRHLYNAALIHDIGMIGVPDSILFKPARLSMEERKLIHHAPVIAAEILESVGSLTVEREIILHQRERWDGKGYPDGLKQANIPMGSRFLAVAKAIDAMTHKRTYRRPYPISYCVEQLRDHAGTQFDAKIAKEATLILCRGESYDGEKKE